MKTKELKATIVYSATIAIIPRSVSLSKQNELSRSFATPSTLSRHTSKYYLFLKKTNLILLRPRSPTKSVN